MQRAEVLARDPWTVRLMGSVHVAKPVSGAKVVAFHQAIATGDAAMQYAAITTLLRWAFPLRWSHWWTGDPVRKILRLPEAEQREILTDFFARLAGRPPAPRGSPTSGTVLRR